MKAAVGLFFLRGYHGFTCILKFALQFRSNSCVSGLFVRRNKSGIIIIPPGLHQGRVKIYRVTGPGPSTGGDGFFSKKRGAETIFRKKDQGARTFFDKDEGGEDFFTIKFENPRFNFAKKAIFEDKKVTYVGSSDSSVLIGV